MGRVHSSGAGSVGAYARLTDLSQPCNFVSKGTDMVVRQGELALSSDDGLRGQSRLPAIAREGRKRLVDRHSQDQQSDAVLARFRQLVGQSKAAGWPSAYAVAMSSAPSSAACLQAQDGPGQSCSGTPLNLDIAHGNDPAGRGRLGGIGDGISHFWSMVVSWWRNGDANREIKAMFHGAVASQIARLERYPRTDNNPIIANRLHDRIGILKAELLRLVDPSSDWPLDMRDVAWLGLAIDSVKELLPVEGGRKSAKAA